MQNYGANTILWQKENNTQWAQAGKYKRTV